MTSVLYLDCFSGISGDMLLGAFIDLGLPIGDLTRALGSLTIDGYSVTADRVLRSGIAATKFTVHEQGSAMPAHSHTHEHSHAHDHAHSHDHGHTHGHEHSHDRGAQPSTHHHHAHRSLAEIHQLIDRSALSPSGRERAKALFVRLGEAEAAIHQMPLDRVHLHEVGALDSIVDIVGAVFAMEWAGVDRIVCSPLNVGGGTVETAHGTLPVPAPATLALLGSTPIYSGRVHKELVTPTGALLATAYAHEFGAMPAMRVRKTGYGAGTRDPKGAPNVLRVVIGDALDTAASDRVVVIECEIDDMNPQLYGPTMDRLHEAGALDVFFVPAQMKKNRPGTLMTVIAPPVLRGAMTEIIFRETTTIGLRHHEVARDILPRELVTVETSLGAVRVKLARRDGQIVNAIPEFEDCATLARQANLPIKEVQALALHAYRAREDAPSLS
ncbi:MAG: nickel pincer cofactor biosynthesis protein LarC [Acidobacteriaceae bacterium]|jgi:uncharacterized protein (TIGR00299 family) protein|nr:nickel pincer cofactor biosynthesis protein LarC [Acidobacteriaceae bacterium]